mgnify:CR=1 FL=1|jgi:hypothetical protein|tara:strand:- start:708 stop:926 length:219 start_codon:yes stop_codon:yes gene_type:complete
MNPRGQVILKLGVHWLGIYFTELIDGQNIIAYSFDIRILFLNLRFYLEERIIKVRLGLLNKYGFGMFIERSP